MTPTAYTPPELFYAYNNYVHYCKAIQHMPIPEHEWSARHTDYLATLSPKSKTLEERIAELERRMNEMEGDNR